MKNGLGRLYSLFYYNNFSNYFIFKTNKSNPSRINKKNNRLFQGGR